jgi:protein SCO1
MKLRRSNSALQGVLLMVLVTAHVAWADERHAMKGLVVSVDPDRKSFVVSHDSVAGVMKAMTMAFDVRDSTALAGVVPGVTVEFTLVVGRDESYADSIRVRPYETVEQDPLTARRLRLLQDATRAGKPESPAPGVGQAIPDFTLTNQARRPIALSQFRGRVVAINFIYTSCALPEFCFRTANHFGSLQRRFKDQLADELVLLTVTFDPGRDTPETLAEYAGQLHADPNVWHFLTGSTPEVTRVCRLFGVDAFQDDGLMNHSLRTAVVDRQGNLAASIEGNLYTARQLGDLLEAVMTR